LVTEHDDEKVVLVFFARFLKLSAPVGILGAIRRSLWTFGLMKMRFFEMSSDCDEKMRESYPQIWDLKSWVFSKHNQAHFA